MTIITPEQFTEAFPESVWYLGDCATLAFAVHIWLASHGVESRIKADVRPCHFWVEIDENRYEGGGAGNYCTTLRPARDVTKKVTHYTNRPDLFVKNFNIYLRVNMFDYIWRRLNEKFPQPTQTKCQIPVRSTLLVRLVQRLVKRLQACPTK